MKKYPMVEVEWEDSASWGVWRPLEEYTVKADPAGCRSAGYLVKADRKSLMLMQSLDEANNKMTDAIVIPRSAVRKVTRLEYKP